MKNQCVPDRIFTQQFHSPDWCSVHGLANFGYLEFTDEFLVSPMHQRQNSLVLKLATEIKYNFEGGDATNEAKLYINQIKDRAWVMKNLYQRKCRMGKFVVPSKFDL